VAAIEITPNTGPGSFEYVPGRKGTAVGFNCAQAGDRITFVGWKFREYNAGVSNVSPDSTGYMPHFAIKPMYVRDAGLGSPAIERVQYTFGDPTAGNIDAFPLIRVDLGSIWLPYAASVTIQGGDGPGEEFGALLVTLQWDRVAWKKATSVQEKRDQKNTLTFYDTSATTRIERPANAVSVFCPDGVDLKLDNGVGTYSTVAAMGPRVGGRSAPLGPYRYVSPIGAKAETIIFTVQL